MTKLAFTRTYVDRSTRKRMANSLSWRRMPSSQRGKIRQNSAVAVACYIEFKPFQHGKKDDKTRIYEDVCRSLNAEKDGKLAFMKTYAELSTWKKYDKTALSRSRAIQNLNHFNVEKRMKKTCFMLTYVNRSTRKNTTKQRCLGRVLYRI